MSVSSFLNWAYCRCTSASTTTTRTRTTTTTRSHSNDRDHGREDIHRARRAQAPLIASSRAPFHIAVLAPPGAIKLQNHRHQLHQHSRILDQLANTFTSQSPQPRLHQNPNHICNRANQIVPFPSIKAFHFLICARLYRAGYAARVLVGSVLVTCR